MISPAARQAGAANNRAALTANERSSIIPAMNLWNSKMIRLSIAILLSVVALFFALAEDGSDEFDFYVLALSWSPSFCERTGTTDTAQCGVNEFGFVVHGLWPQYEVGYPEYCQSGASTRVDNATHDRVFDIMPSTGLIRSQWKKHGICTGLEQDTYFNVLRDAFAKISIPADYQAPLRDNYRNPAAIEAAFIAANPGIDPDGIAVTCKNRQLADVRICMTKDLQFRDCREVDQRACRSNQIEIPGVR